MASFARTALPRGVIASVRRTRTHNSSIVKCFSTAPIDPFAPTDSFLRRHVGPTELETEEMLKTVGFNTLDELIESTIPEAIRVPNKLSTMDGPKGEQEALAKLRGLAAKNKVAKSFIGMGYHGTVTPGVIKRNVFENPGWYTAYTPYQAEIAQGRLEALLNYQTAIADLTGLPFANASLLDEATAAAEAMFMAHSHLRGKRAKFFVASGVHPQTLAVLQTRAAPLGIELVVGDPLSPADLDLSSHDYCGVLLQYPDTLGGATDFHELAAEARDAKTLVVAAADPLSLVLLRPPGEWGADICVGSAQRFGVPMFYGGPHAGYLATRDALKRRVPGRVIGVSVDSRGKPALRMALQAREQHIRRDKATSNICTAQALLANAAGMYAVYHGPQGLRHIALRVHTLAAMLKQGLADSGAGFGLPTQPFFDTLTIDVAAAGSSAQAVCDAAAAAGMNVRVVSDGSVGVSFDETHEPADVVALLRCFGVEGADAQALAATQSVQAAASGASFGNLERGSAILTHPVFNSHHSETEMLRYLHSLERKDLALNSAMISLGSCTMKLNATSEMEPVLWPEFANQHPFAPDSQTVGTREMIAGLDAALADITGFAAISAQPNSGANGEYAGLLAIKAYHESRGEGHRDVCLIPVSAHGTNPASAAMAGMRVVVVGSDDCGNVDLEDLKAKVAQHGDSLSALMITYPSTYGVFEEGVRDIIAAVHAAGGQVYMDGANMNAQVGHTSPGDIGADVCHLNLHKTFCIPHGGGGPGVGSIGVAEHLAPFLPGHAVAPVGGNGRNTVSKAGGAVAAAPYGSAGILPISWMYIEMLGNTGLTAATSMAILNANYLATRLQGHYDILYRGSNGQCAHEFIIDLRAFKAAGVVEEDVAKRLQDYGFHGPTMSWPVPGTLMVEPTESEPRAELDRFCDAMIAIRGEIEEVVAGRADPENNVLRNSPHTVDTVCADTWDRPYSRETAAYPVPALRHNKFWPTVGRIDNVHGDRNLVCTCPPIESYTE